MKRLVLTALYVLGTALAVGLTWFFLLLVALAAVDVELPGPAWAACLALTHAAGAYVGWKLFGRRADSP